MTFFGFLTSLPFSDDLSYFLLLLLTFLVGFGVYKFVKDWLPW